MTEAFRAEYWDGTVMCPRKGWCHINHGQCLSMHDETSCGSCRNKDVILVEIERGKLAVAKSKAECKALSNQKPRAGRRGRPKKKDPDK